MFLQDAADWVPKDPHRRVLSFLILQLIHVAHIGRLQLRRNDLFLTKRMMPLRPRLNASLTCPRLCRHLVSLELVASAQVRAQQGPGFQCLNCLLAHVRVKAAH